MTNICEICNEEIYCTYPDICSKCSKKICLNCSYIDRKDNNIYCKDCIEKFSVKNEIKKLLNLLLLRIDDNNHVLSKLEKYKKHLHYRFLDYISYLINEYKEERYYRDKLFHYILIQNTIISEYVRLDEKISKELYLV